MPHGRSRPRAKPEAPVNVEPTQLPAPKRDKWAGQGSTLSPHLCASSNRPETGSRPANATRTAWARRHALYMAHWLEQSRRPLRRAPAVEGNIYDGRVLLCVGRRNNQPPSGRRQEHSKSMPTTEPLPYIQQKSALDVCGSCFCPTVCLAPRTPAIVEVLNPGLLVHAAILIMERLDVKRRDINLIKHAQKPLFLRSNPSHMARNPDELAFRPTECWVLQYASL